MFLLPKPQSVVPGKGSFFIKYSTRIILDSSLDYTDFEAAKLLKDEIYRSTGLNLPVTKAYECDEEDYIYLKHNSEMEDSEEYLLIVSEKGITIEASHSRGIFYGIATLRQLVRINSTGMECVTIKDKPYFKNRAYMLDITRGRVPTTETVKELIDRLAFYKINQLQLYIEHTFAFKNHSEVWSKTDPITAEEILEIDRYCKIRGIELVPCIATFGHLYDTLSASSFKHLREMEGETGEPFTWFHRMRYHIINVSDPGSFELVKSMLDEFLPLFSSDKFNICCDETFDLGKGKSRKLAEQEGYGRLYMGFVNRLVAYLETKGKQVMMWGDIVLNHPECIPQIPESVTCLNWFYYYNAKEENIRTFKENNVKQYVCPSVSGFSRLVNEMDMSFTNIKDMVKLGQKYNADGVLNTDWGDSGHVNHLAGSMAGIIYGAALSWNPDDERSFEQADEAVSMVEYGDRTCRLISLIRELSKQDIVIFNTFTFFRDFKVYGLPYKVFGTCLYENAKKELMDADGEKLFNASSRAEEIVLKLMKHSVNICGDKNQDMKEYFLSARGVSLMQALALIIKKYEYGQEVKLAYTPCDLAGKLEYWLYDYCSAWRVRNRESELFRIKEFVFDICRILRSYRIEERGML